ncbi:MAG: hypothetical protein ABFS16_04145 [Bacteroidota bacterium]
MASKKIKLQRLAKKGMNVTINIPDLKSWNEMTAKDKKIPRSFTQTKSMIHKVLGTKEKRVSHSLKPEIMSPRVMRRAYKKVPLNLLNRGYIKRRSEECHEEQIANIYLGLSNPRLTAIQRKFLELEILNTIPGFERVRQTEHFILRWTNESDHADDNIADETIVEETGEFLEQAWERYVEVFGRAPYLPEGETRMEVLFQDFGAIGLASPPDGPMQLNSSYWVNEPEIRRPTSAHELFHKLQYAFGYRTKHTPSGSYKWFSEGTASWSEVFMWQRISRSYKINDMFSNPDLNLYSASYRALPYWIFFEARLKDSVNDNALSDFLHKYESLPATTAYPERVAYAEVIDEDWPENNVYGNVDNFFALFSRERRLGAWKTGPTGQLYPTILGPENVNLVPALTVTNVSLGSGDAYSNAGSVSDFGSDYYKFNFEYDSNGENLTISVNGSSSGDFSFYLIWEYNGNFKRASFPFNNKEDYSGTYTINRSWANGLVLIISGRGDGGSYTINASIT